MREPMIIGFVAENAHRVLQDNSMALNELFKTLGYATSVIDLLRPDCFDRLKELGRTHDVSFGYGYAGIGAHLRMGDKFLWDEAHIPFLSLLYDHPFYHPAQHRVETRYVCNCYAVRDFYEVQRDYIKSAQPSAQFSPHSPGYIESLCLPWQERDIDAVYCKRGRDLKVYEDSFAVMPPVYRAITWDCIRAAQTNSGLMLADFVRDGLAASGVDFRRDEKTWDDFVYVVRVIDEYLRHWRSNQLVEGLKRLPVMIVGDGWDHIDKTGAKASFVPPIPALEAKWLFFRARFVFNTHPYARYAWHERVFQGIESGAAVITDRTRFTDEHFADLPNFFGFDWADPEKFEKISAFMERTRHAPLDMEPAKKRLAQRFPPNGTVMQMIDIAGKIREGGV
jgi:hypothetical protein